MRTLTLGLSFIDASSPSFGKYWRRMRSQMRGLGNSLSLKCFSPSESRSEREEWSARISFSVSLIAVINALWAFTCWQKLVMLMVCGIVLHSASARVTLNANGISKSYAKRVVSSTSSTTNQVGSLMYYCSNLDHFYMNLFVRPVSFLAS